MEDLKSLSDEVAKPDLQTNQSHSQSIALAHERWDAAPRGLKIIANIAFNFLLIAISGLTAYLFGLAFKWVMQASEGLQISEAIPTVVFQEIAALTLMSGLILFTLQDLIRLFDRKLKLPFEFSLNKASNIYWNRIQISLLAISFNAILLCLYLSFPSMALVSGVFLAAVFSVAILAIRKSAPIPKIGFYLSLFFFVVVIATIPIVKAMYGPVDTSNKTTRLFVDN